jgi:hypothetical protein
MTTIAIPQIEPSGASLRDCKVIDFPKIADPRGNLTFIEGERHIPFAIQRIFYLYDVPGGAERGGHAHKALHQLIIGSSAEVPRLVYVFKIAA